MGMDDNTLRHIEEQKTIRSLITAVAVGALGIIAGTTYYNTDGHFERRPQSVPNPNQGKTYADIAIAKADERIDEANKLIDIVFQTPRTETRSKLMVECVDKLLEAYKAKQELIERYNQPLMTNFPSTNGCECVNHQKIDRITHNPVDTPPKGE